MTRFVPGFISGLMLFGAWGAVMSPGAAAERARVSAGGSFEVENQLLQRSASNPKRIVSIGDGRLCFGNGHVFGVFVGPMEQAEEPIHQIHDKLNQLRLGYSSPVLVKIGAAPMIKNLKTGEQWTVGACHAYRLEDGAAIMETQLPVGKVRTETYGLWDQPVLVRRIIFTPAAGDGKDFQIGAEWSLYKELPNMPAGDWEAPPSRVYPKPETIRVSPKERLIGWEYADELFRKVALRAEEPSVAIHIVDPQKGVLPGEEATFEGTSFGAVRFERRCGARGGSLTIALAFDRDAQAARKLVMNRRGKSLALKSVQQRWADWHESGSVVKTGHQRLDQACRNQLMMAKAAQDAELGGIIVAAGYDFSVWARDMLIATSVLINTGHYAEARKALLFFSRHAYWNVHGNCFQVSFHNSGRAIRSFCLSGEAPVEDILPPGEWGRYQWHGPEQDSMGYYLYNIGKYHRCTGDDAFIRGEWPFIQKVGDALARDEFCVSELGPQEGYVGYFEKDLPFKKNQPVGATVSPGPAEIDENLIFRKYSRERGLLVDDCYEHQFLREYTLVNCLAVLGFREGYRLSRLVGVERPLWLKRSNDLNAAVRKYCVKTDPVHGPYLVQAPSVSGFTLEEARKTVPWLNNAAHDIPCDYYPWTVASTVPLFNYRDPLLKSSFRGQPVEPPLVPDSWTMFYGPRAHAAFEADRPDIGWHVLKRLLERMPVSLLAPEQNQDVTAADGTVRHIARPVFCFIYLPDAVQRGLAGLGYDENAGHWFFRPQVPEELGKVRANIRIGGTRFDAESSGNGDSVAAFTIDGKDQPLTGILDPKYLDGKRHRVVIRMQRSSKLIT